ncbi:MAG: hypothetical protein HOV92_37010 [Streptomyces sp.]|nr:hypothetical protein [Streptomyces sp.]
MTAVRADIAAMLRAGATYRQIIAATGANPTAISHVRKALRIPLPEGRRHFQGPRSVAETLAHYTQPQADGHAHWTGPFNGTRPTLWHHDRQYQARRIAFITHHGREPQGPVQVGCTDLRCIAGAHLTDHPIRQAHARADQAFDAIFGTDA